MRPSTSPLSRKSASFSPKPAPSIVAAPVQADPSTRYLYRLEQTTQGRCCILTRDCEALALAVGGKHSFGGMVSSDRLHDCVDLARNGAFEPGVRITCADTWENAVAGEQAVFALYPGTTADDLRRMGFGHELDAAAAYRTALQALGA